MSHRLVTRRTFVTKVTAASLTTAGTLFTARRLPGQTRTASFSTSGVGASRMSAQALLPEPLAPLNLQQLATRAIEAATRAGATYADVRVGERHDLDLVTNLTNLDQANARLTATFTYGVRVLVDGAWAFLHGRVPSVEAITASARDAVAMAKGYAPLVVHHAELVPAPAATGEWATPYRDDPFAVPLREHSALVAAYHQLTERVPRTQLWFGPRFEWTRETRVFASSEGTLTTQTLRGVHPTMGVAVPSNFTGWVKLQFPPLAAAAGGYELVADPTRYETAFLTFVEDAARHQRLPRQTVDVGRYPLVVDGRSVGLLFGATIGTALELDRVLGEEADASGTSYLGPPLQWLGTSIGSPQLTVTATRAMPTFGAVRWDDEGVEAHEYPVVTAGRLVDYHTSRWTAPALKDWYARQGHPLRSHGCAVATEASAPLTVRAPHLVIAPSATSASLETLCRDIHQGLLVMGVQNDPSSWVRAFTTDQQFASSSVMASRDGPGIGVLLKVENGKLAGRVVGNGLDMSMKRLWKDQLVALGDASTVQQSDHMANKGMPWRTMLQSTSAPAALFKDVNVITYPRTA